MATLPPSTSQQIADAAGLDERYVREWLGGLSAAGIVRYDPARVTFEFPRSHAAVLTRAAGPDNLAQLMQYIPMLGGVEDRVLESLQHGGGLDYAEYPRFQATMAEESATVNDAVLVDGILPLVPGLPDRLTAGIDVLDVGCGSGHAINLMAKAFPASRFVGYDFSAEGIANARAEAAEWGLTNTRFEAVDVAGVDEPGHFDLVTAFDAVHDQAHPARVLANIRSALREDGVFLMVDIKASSNVEDNAALPWGSYLYAISMFHCMSVSLGLDGDGLGTVWGTQLAERMLGDAGFTDVAIVDVPADPFNAYFVARP
ncbi:methyltransferase domain-containing protein [Occultella glacieicola]|uniref:Methyltransferase domain-containing protein n=2 Tax=Occultella glacieicola TaxID=2518684 RepID=A0ABY2E9I8_9MICO|nr:methyltransferase domain-containing protein [Occultella glacieicola]